MIFGESPRPPSEPCTAAPRLIYMRVQRNGSEPRPPSSSDCLSLPHGSVESLAASLLTASQKKKRQNKGRHLLPKIHNATGSGWKLFVCSAQWLGGVGGL
ncbi:unnamed protein product [Pleuronectes platessa]|uniref:Uncharacterized protein n=1 Tax=Pleuronectes platessa TaxID=8262 RepID=A0A9N7U6E6_PLEPL|nr:unnamed protein product [Pleuronectes platessa]